MQCHGNASPVAADADAAPAATLINRADLELGFIKAAYNKI